MIGDLRLEVGGRTIARRDVDATAADRDEVERAGDEGCVVALPSDEPARFLRLLDACLRTKRAALPVPGNGSCVGRSDLPATDAALVLATSGSTGEPKFAAFDHDAVVRSAARIATSLELATSDVVAVLSPLHHAYGLVGQLFAAASAGARVRWARSPFADEQVAACTGVTVLSSVAFGLRRLVDAGIEGSSARLVCSAGGRLSRAIAGVLAERFPHATLVNQYGCTEAGPRLTACRSSEPGFFEGSVGRPIDGVRLRIDESGEIFFATDAAMRGYLGAPRLEGFAPTGDLGSLDARGALTVLGRKDAVVKIRGEKVSLDRVAAAAEAIGATSACALVRELEGDDAIVLYVEGAAPTRRALAEHLPLEALPDRIERVASMPRLASGKIDRRALRDQPFP